MKWLLIPLLHFAVATIAGSIPAFAQTIDEGSNWYKEIGRYDDPYSRFDFRRYTKDDVDRAKAKYLKIVSTVTDDEWAGTYKQQTMLGSAEITWGRQNGFVYTCVYHTLADIDYGSVAAVNDSVRFISERPTDGKRKQLFEVEHIRVIFGEKHLLVPKSRLSDFASLAAGLEVPDNRRKKEIDVEESYFWEKVEDENKKIGNVPIYPASYMYLIRNPIQLKILSAGKLRIKREKSANWGTTSEDHLRMLRLSGGRRQGVRKGMRFWIDDLEEWVEIISVTASQSVAELSRPFIDGKEYCHRYENLSQIEFPCHNPKVGMPARTKTEYF